MNLALDSVPRFVNKVKADFEKLLTFAKRHSEKGRKLLSLVLFFGSLLLLWIIGLRLLPSSYQFLA